MGAIAEDLRELWAPIMTPDLGDYADALGAMFAHVELYALDRVDELTGEEIPGWAILLDPDLCPLEALPYLARYVGEELPVGLSEAQQREWIKDNPSAFVGTNYAILRAAQRKLTGDRRVSITERLPTTDTVTVLTYTHQTPDPEGTRRDILEVVSMDTIVNYLVLDGQLWVHVKKNVPTWGAVKAEYATWADAKSDLTGGDVFTRPAV